MAVNRTGPSIPGDIATRRTNRPERLSPRGGPAPVPGSPSTYPPSGPVQPASVTIKPPLFDRPPMARDINRFGILTGATSGNTPAQLTGSAFELPQGMVGVIRSIVLDVNDLLASSDIVWALRFNQGPVQGWDALTVFPRNVAAAQLAYTPEETAIPIPEGTLVDFELTVNDGGTYTAGVAWHGWMYPADVSDRFEGVWNR